MEIILELDYFVLVQMHQLAVACGEGMTFLMKLISLMGDKGACIFLLAFVLMCSPKTRRAGICVFGAVCIGTIIGNGFLKFLIHRNRPFKDMMIGVNDWWHYVGAPMKESSSFPSGHTMAIAAGMQALYLTYRQKRYIVLLVVLSLVMGASRCYLMVHYFTDILGGIIVGIISAIISAYITKQIYQNEKLKEVLLWKR